MKRKCIFFDRDGIVNHPPSAEDRYVMRVEDFRIMPEFLDALRLVGDRGYEAVIVTNQSGVGRGKLTQQVVDSIHDNLIRILEKKGLKLLDIIMCPSADDNHPDRKPNAGMLLTAAKKHDLDLTQSWMVGDQERDVVAGQRAGCKTILVRNSEKPTVANHRVVTMAGLLALLEKVL